MILTLVLYEVTDTLQVHFADVNSSQNVYQVRKKMINASQWKTVKVITSLHTLIVFHFESEFQSNYVPG